MKRTLVLALALSAGCARERGVVAVSDTRGLFTAAAPAGWKSLEPDGGGGFRRAFVGEREAHDEGAPLGAVLEFSRLPRRRADFSGTDAEFAAFARRTLRVFDAYFGAAPDWLPPDLSLALGLMEKGERDGHPTRRYSREYEHFNRAHMARGVPMRREQLIVQTPRAYLVVDFAATRELFPRTRFAYDLALESLRVDAQASR